MKKVIQYIILLLLVSNICRGQTFVKIFGEKGKDDNATALAVLSTGDILVVGNTKSNTSDNGIDGLILKVDNLGNLSWQKNYSTNTTGQTTNEWLYNVIVDEANNAVYACGTASPGGAQNTKRLPWILKVKISDGSIIWSRTYKPSSINIGFQTTPNVKDNAIGGYASSIRYMNSTRFMITGVLNDDNSFANVGGLVFIIDNNGDLVSGGLNNFYEINKEGNAHLSINNTIASSLTDFFAVGNATEGGTLYDPMLFRFNSNGNIAAFNRYKWAIDNDGIYTINWKNGSPGSGELLLSGHYRGNNLTTSNAEGKMSFLSVKSSDLSLLRHSIYELESNDKMPVNSPKCRPAIVNNNTNFISPIQLTGASADMGFVIVDGDGTRQSDIIIGTSAEDICYDADQTPDGGYIFIGTTKFFEINNTNNNDVVIIKVDKEGKIENLPPCFLIKDDSLVSINPNPTEIDLDSTRINNPAIDLIIGSNSIMTPKLRDTTCIPPCNCIATPKITLFAGRPKLNPPSEQLSCNNSEVKKIECNKLYYLLADPSCTQGCTGTIDSIKWIKNNVPIGIVKNPDIMLPVLVTESGNYEAWVYSTCGDKTCGICKIKFTATCTCPPPECCKDKPGVEGNSINVSQVNGGTQFMANLAITGTSAAGYKEVRVQVLDVQIGSDNNNTACIDCLKNPRQWGSITSALMQGFSTALATATGNNREAVLTANSAQTMQGKSLVFNMLLPPKSTLECCKLYADVYIRITLRDDQCRECDTIISGRVYLTDLKLGTGGGNDDNNDNPSGNEKKVNRLFPNQKQFQTIPNQKGIKSQGLK